MANKSVLRIVIIALAVILVGVVITGIFLGAKKGWFQKDKGETTPVVTTGTDTTGASEGTENTDVPVTDPDGTVPGTTGAEATTPTSGKNPEDPDNSGNVSDDPDIIDKPEDTSPTQPQVTEPTEPPEPTVGVDTETDPPKPDNVIDFDDLLNAGKDNGGE